MVYGGRYAGRQASHFLAMNCYESVHTLTDEELAQRIRDAATRLAALTLSVAAVEG